MTLTYNLFIFMIKAYIQFPFIPVFFCYGGRGLIQADLKRTLFVFFFFYKKKLAYLSGSNIKNIYIKKIIILKNCCPQRKVLQLLDIKF